MFQVESTETSLTAMIIINFQYFKVGSNTYTQDVDLIRVQDESLIHKDVLGLEYDTEYRFRIALLRTFDNDRLTETIGVSTVAVGRTQCRGEFHFMCYCVIIRSDFNA